jgi:acyl-CoA reductase-like NAD-dependent aldehyde dehydrogenase
MRTQAFETSQISAASRAKSDGRYDMQREIFGPILPIKTYADRQEVANYINNHDRPLAIYLRILTIADRDSN